MFVWMLLLFSGLTPADVLERDELFSVRGDGRACASVPASDRGLFTSWKLDPERTREQRGIFGLYNPASPDQLVLFFAERDVCEQALRTFTEKSLIEADPVAELPIDEAKVQTLVGNPRDINASEALLDAEKLVLYPERSLWCACPIVQASMRCEFEGASREVVLAPVVPVRAFGPTFEAWKSGDERCTKRGRTFSGRR
ncbi:MAG: hypothetical protein AAFY60_20785, partial [Myxococcota bacterium]